MSEGAAPELWDQWADVAFANGFLEDLLPTIGKRPFIKNWTKTNASEVEISLWKHNDHNIGIRASYLRFIDIDIPNDALATQITAFIRMRYEMPLRYRANTGKCLLAFCMKGLFDKLSFKCKALVNGGTAGSIEFLANKQQAVVGGIHPDGTEYQWSGGVPTSFPELTSVEFDHLWRDLQTQFAITGETNSLAPAKSDHAITDDVADYLRSNNLITKEEEGRLHLIHCPWEHEHTDQQTLPTQAIYFVAHTGGYANGAYKCMHEHCKDRTLDDFKIATGYVLEDFEVPSGDPEILQKSDKLFSEKPPDPIRFAPISWDLFAARPAPKWIVAGIIPQAELAVIYGASGSGKTFMALDLAFAIARGIPWRGHKVNQGRVVYLCAEAAGGVRNRIKAYARHYDLNPADASLDVIDTVPNLLVKDDALAVAKAIGKASVVIVDTFAQVTAGGNENSGEDMGKALAHCKGIHIATGAMVILIHHAGKDETKGARGWSGIRAAADAEIEVYRTGQGNGAKITKQKDADDNEAWGFRLQPITIDENEDGIISSCYVEYATTAPVKSKDMPKRGIWQTLLLETFDELGGVSELSDTVINKTIPKGVGELRRRRYMIQRALMQLQEKGEVKILDGIISRPL